MKISLWKFIIVKLLLKVSDAANPIGNPFQNCFITENRCPNENITFWLYTKETEFNPIKLNIFDLHKEDFLPRKPLKIIIHGYTGSKDYDPNPQIRPALLHEKDVFVLSVDYAPLAKVPCYIQAAKNIETVSKCLGDLINALIEQDIVKNDDIHVIGFSLGGQTAGMTANFLHTKLKRITALDPAKPLFMLATEWRRIDPSDAEFVDVIHTDVLQRGYLMPVGHVDFYPNSGYDQPGCESKNFTSRGSCNHARAPEYYAESIVSDIGFYGYECSSWFNHMLGLCRNTNHSKFEMMGYDVSKDARGSYFLHTNPVQPFARGRTDSAKKLYPLPDGYLIEENILFDSKEEED